MTYRGIARFLRRLTSCVRDHGIRTGLQWVSANLRRKSKSGRSLTYNVFPGGALHPIKLRGASSDFFVFDQIYIDKEYAPFGDLQPRSILDLGANIGLASAWFLGRYPNARVVAVEANPDNLKILQENLLPYGERAQVIQGGVWSRCADLTVVRRVCEADAQVRESKPTDDEKNRVKGWDVPTLMKLGKLTEIDLLEVDIEGSELEIFRNGADKWLPFVKNISIELHGQQCEAAFFSALAAYDFSEMRSGELTMCTNLRRKMAASSASADAISTSPL